MIVVEDNPTRFFTVVGAAYVPEASNPTLDRVTTLSMDDLFNDPEVCRRVGAVIAEAAKRTSDATALPPPAAEPVAPTQSYAAPPGDGPAVMVEKA
jgi:hypothetical protein